MTAAACLRRRRLLLGALALSAPAARAADPLAAFSQRDAAVAVRAALEQGARAAVDLLGRTDGFWQNDKVRIPLPDWIARAESGLRLIGRGADVDELRVGVNRAAEQAVPEARTLLADAVRRITLQDAKAILSGGDDSVTRYFADKTRKPLVERFVPVVTRATERIGLAKQYNQLAGQAERLGLLHGDQARIERHVTAKALDGLYLVIGEEERKLRQDPVQAGSDLLKKVLGALK